MKPKFSVVALIASLLGMISVVVYLAGIRYGYVDTITFDRFSLVLCLFFCFGAVFCAATLSFVRIKQAR